MKLSSPFFHQALATNQLMALVILALIPGIVLQSYFFGYGTLINLILCGLCAISTEALVLKLRNRPIIATLKDNSALLTGLLMGCALPPTLPFWMTIIGVGFAVIFAKQLYGGLGYNPFNPAMVGYVLLLISFPVEMTAWLPSREMTAHQPDFLESLQLIFLAKTLHGDTVETFRQMADGFTMATPLDYIKTEATRGHMISEIFSTTFFLDNVSAWRWVNSGYLVGGIFLLIKGIIRWHIPFSILFAVIVTSTILNWHDAELYSPFEFHLFAGATMLGAFFIATDPVSATTTPKGRLIYGALIGFLIVIIRSFGGYPEAVAFAVLLMNIATPTIDHYTKPIIYGHKKERELHD